MRIVLGAGGPHIPLVLRRAEDEGVRVAALVDHIPGVVACGKDVLRSVSISGGRSTEPVGRRRCGKNLFHKR